MNGTSFPQQAYKVEVTDNSATAQDQLGTRRFVYDSTNGLRGYTYVQLDADAAAAGANGTVYTFSDVYKKEVTNDISASHPNKPAGVGVGTLTLGYYGYIQHYGYHSAVKTDGGDDIAAGDTVIVDPSVDGTADSVAQGTAPTHKPLGVAVAADVDASNTVAVFLDC